MLERDEVGEETGLLARTQAACWDIIEFIMCQFESSDTETDIMWRFEICDTETYHIDDLTVEIQGGS